MSIQTALNNISPLVSEFESKEQESSYVSWLNAKVKASLDDTSPRIPHDQVMKEARILLESKRKKHALG